MATWDENVARAVAANRALAGLPPEAMWANPFIDPDKPMTNYRVSIVCDTQLTERQFVELVHHWLESPGVGEAGFDLSEPGDELRALQVTYRDTREMFDRLQDRWNRLNLGLAESVEDAEQHLHVPADTPIGPWVSTHRIRSILRAALASPGEGE